MDTDNDNGNSNRDVNWRLHNRSAAYQADKEEGRQALRARSQNPAKTKQDSSAATGHAAAYAGTELDRQIRGDRPEPKTFAFIATMKNRARIINGAIMAGTLSLFVLSFSAMNFFVIVFAEPETIAKIRYLKFGMSVFGSICVFLNALCIFLLCWEMKYAITHYVKQSNNEKR